MSEDDTVPARRVGEDKVAEGVHRSFGIDVRAAVVTEVFVAERLLADAVVARIVECVGVTDARVTHLRVLFISESNISKPVSHR